MVFGAPRGAWAPGLGTAAVSPQLSDINRFAGPVSVGVMVMSAAIFVGGLIWSVMRPGRGLHDLLSGTHIVIR